MLPNIFHVDMDAFFVSVEELFDPFLKGKPVVVGGQAHERGVVSAASYAARQFGIHSAMPLRTASKLCPHAIFVDGHPDRYREYSRKVREVLGNFSPAIEMASIDEAYLDMTGTGRLHGPPFRAAHLLHDAIHCATQLRCSIGIGSSRLIAKVCSDQAKPNGILWIYPGAEAAFLAPLEIRKIPGVGKVTEQKLLRLGIRKVGDIAGWDEAAIQEHLGNWALSLLGKSCGLDAGAWFSGSIGDSGDPKSISHEHTFDEDTSDRNVIETTLVHLSEMVARRLREHKLHARTVQLKLRNTRFETITRARTLKQATQLDVEISSAIRGLLHGNWRGDKVRLLGVHVSSLSRVAGQENLLEDGYRTRWREAMTATDRMRDRFGDAAPGLAAGMQGSFRERTHEAMIDAPKNNVKGPGDE